MSSSLPINRVLEIVKSLVDNIRCPICGKSNGSRGRYICGHTVCDECMAEAEVCVLCLTPPANIGDTKLKVDHPLSVRAKNACNLLTSSLDTFHTDVYVRHRVSEQLKIEREVFPECIQAPIKYHNKRKSHSILEDKENRFGSILPGELTSPRKEVKMNNTTNIVKQWLNKNETYSRRALSDLNVNENSFSSKNENRNILNSRKRIHTYSPIRIQGNKKIKTKRKSTKTNILENSLFLDGKSNTKCEHDESGIVLDDEPIFIEDSQSQIIDKDELALLAVEAADKAMLSSVSVKSLEITQDIDPLPIENETLMFEPVYDTNSMVVGKVPFYKKGSLLETCTYCEENIIKEGKNIADDSKNVSITIDDKNFYTTINISNCNVTLKNKSTVFVQTDINDIIALSNNTFQEKQDIPDSTKDNNKKNLPKSQDLFLDDIHIHEAICNITAQGDSEKITPKSKEQYLMKSQLIIDDSDSDTYSEEPIILKVSADIHRSPNTADYGILDEICTERLVCRSKKKVRHPTPDSSNSSEKENCDPNKRKNRKVIKKKKSVKL